MSSADLQSLTLRAESRVVLLKPDASVVVPDPELGRSPEVGAKGDGL